MYISAVIALSICIFLTFLYITGLYVWKISLDRNEPDVIKWRSLSTIFVTLISVVLVWQISNDFTDFLTKLGIPSIRKSFYEVCKGLFLTTVLFAGPLVQPNLLRTAPSYWFSAVNWIYYQPRWLLFRNFIISPITEEIVFRASFLAFLTSSSFTVLQSIATASFIFSFAHLHHLIEIYFYYKQDEPSTKDIKLYHILEILSEGLLQATYTFLFGIYAGYLFANTKSILCCTVVHSFCNFIGPPALSEFFLKAEQPSLPDAIQIFSSVVWLADPTKAYAIRDNRIMSYSPRKTYKTRLDPGTNVLGEIETVNSNIHIRMLLYNVKGLRCLLGLSFSQYLDSFDAVMLMETFSVSPTLLENKYTENIEL
ncbi:hypothetical protein GJ496_005315 [Pomphorhynchus laevis]|nr:hypothetical protein GJ496_005315 [Pomphorhynchus laevis]